MSGVRISEHFGILIRKAALQRCNLDRSRLLSLMEANAPFDEDEHLISFGPHFGHEACQTLLQRLEVTGLQYGHDVIDIADMLPDWLYLNACYTSPDQKLETTESACVPLSIQDALDIWRVLEALTVSLDKIGSYEAHRGTEAGMRALSAYFQPRLFRRIASARQKLVEVLITSDPSWDEKLEQLAIDADTIGYWQGEGTS